MLQLSPSTDRRTPRTAPAIEHRAESEWAVPAGMVQAGADLVRRCRWDPITIGMLADGWSWQRLAPQSRLPIPTPIQPDWLSA
jgi:hypothetical protein